MWKTHCRHRQAGVGVHAVVPTLFASSHSALGLSARPSPREEDCRREGSRTAVGARAGPSLEEAPAGEAQTARGPGPGL